MQMYIYKESQIGNWSHTLSQAKRWTDEKLGLFKSSIRKMDTQTEGQKNRLYIRLVDNEHENYEWTEQQM